MPSKALLQPMHALAGAERVAGAREALHADPPVVDARAVLARAAADPGFRSTVDAAALHVLTAKQAYGLLPAARGPPCFRISMPETAGTPGTSESWTTPWRARHARLPPGSNTSTLLTYCPSGASSVR